MDMDMDMCIYVCIYIYIYIHVHIYIYIYGRFPTPASTKNTKSCVRIEQSMPYQSNKHRGYMKTHIPHATPRKHTMLSWPASGYA